MQISVSAKSCIQNFWLSDVFSLILHIISITMEKQINIDGLSINYDVSGPEDGAPIVIMHGWGCNLHTVESIANALNHKMRVYNIDLPGHGKSDEPKEVWGVEDYTRLVEKFIDTINIERPVLLGHSFGGRVSILLSSRRDIPKVILVDAAGVKPKRPLKYYVKVYTYKTLKHTLPIIFGKKRGQQLIDAYRGKSGSADYNAASPMMRAILSKCVNEDLCHVMPRIKASTLLIWGDNDTATPLSDAKKMESLIPDAGLVSFPDCGHYSFLDNPHGFRAVLQEFLKNELK